MDREERGVPRTVLSHSNIEGREEEKAGRMRFSSQ